MITLENAKKVFKNNNIYYSVDTICNKPTIIAYEKKFRWRWVATQLNTFIVVSDFADELVDVNIIQNHLNESFQYAKKHYTGWPRGFQSGIAIISVLITSNCNEEAKHYCEALLSGKKWAGFTIPVMHDSNTQSTYFFKKPSLWGRIYFPHFKRLIQNLK